MEEEFLIDVIKTKLVREDRPGRPHGARLEHDAPDFRPGTGSSSSSTQWKSNIHTVKEQMQHVASAPGGPDAQEDLTLLDPCSPSP